MKVILVAAITFSIWSTTAVAASCPETADQADRLVAPLPLVASKPEGRKPENGEKWLMFGHPRENTYNSSSVKVLGARPTKIITEFVSGIYLYMTFYLPGKQSDYIAAFRSAYPEAGDNPYVLDMFREGEAQWDLASAEVNTSEKGQTSLVCVYQRY